MGHRRLTKALIKHDVLESYRRSALGIHWSLFILLIFTFMFSVVFKARWTGSCDFKAAFTQVYFPGFDGYYFVFRL